MRYSDFGVSKTLILRPFKIRNSTELQEGDEIPLVVTCASQCQEVLVGEKVLYKERLKMKSENASRKLHAVLIPYPAQGHLTPFLQLAKKLVAVHGFRITFVNTTHIHDRFMKSRSSSTTHPNHKGIEFVTVSDGLPEDHPRLRDLAAFNKVTLEMGPIFEELFTNLLKKTSITCVIRDRLFVAVQHIARSLDIPVAVFVASSAISTHCLYNLNTFIAAGILPIPAPSDASTPTRNAVTLTLALPQSAAEAAARSARLTCLPGGAPTMRVEDIPTTLLTHDLEHFFIRFFLEHQNPLFPECDCVLHNTFSDLEGDVLNAMRGSMNENIFGVGPLVLDTAAVDGVEEVSLAGVGSGLWEEDPVSLSWLDGRKPKSVIFVSFGSIATVCMEQMREFAAGLEASNAAFLWVIRPDLIDDTSQHKECETMFTEFVKRTQNRALLVPWAPQAAVLSHPAVGAFLTHCGWNSTIESISSGVPMLGWPRFADQNTNSHYVTSVWKVGLELRQSTAEDGSAVVLKEEIAHKVKKIMGDSEREDQEVLEIRRSARNMQMAARQAVSNEGSSQAALSQFVELITSLRTTDGSKS